MPKRLLETRMLFLWPYLNSGECTVFVFKPHLKDRLRERVCYQPRRRLPRPYIQSRHALGRRIPSAEKGNKNF